MCFEKLFHLEEEDDVLSQEELMQYFTEIQDPKPTYIRNMVFTTKEKFREKCLENYDILSSQNDLLHQVLRSCGEHHQFFTQYKGIIFALNNYSYILMIETEDGESETYLKLLFE
jgi:hypothetical protein